MTRAVRIAQFGGPEVLTVVEIADPVPGSGQVVIDVRAAGVNPIDWRIRAGQRTPSTITEPIGLGSDAAGVVSVLGAGVDGVAVGDEVIAKGLSGAYASQVLATPAQLTAKPADMSWEQAAGLGVPVGTAYQALKSLELSSGETLLVHAGSGGVGQAAIQFAVAWGATVVATASAANQERLRELGAIPVVYGPGLIDRVRAAAPQGVDVAFDIAGTDEALETSLELVPDHSRIATIVAMFRAADLGIRTWSGAIPGSIGPVEQALRTEAIGAACELFERGQFDIEIAAVYPLDKVADAHRQSETGHVRGKIVLVP